MIKQEQTGPSVVETDPTQFGGVGDNPPIAVVAGIIVVRDRVLICQRKRTGRFPLKWEFPGGKVEPGETAAEALSRELLEELGIRAEVGACIGQSVHSYREGPSVSVAFFEVSSFQGSIRGQDFNEVRWVRWSELAEYDFLEADREVVLNLAGKPEGTRWGRGQFDRRCP